MPPKDKEYQVTDRPAENGIRLNNALLTVLILVSGAFGTVLLTTLNKLADDVAVIKVANGKTSVKFEGLEHHMEECKRLHESHARRLRALEIQLGGPRI